MSSRLPVFYSPRMVARPRSFSPSAAKPQQVVESWQQAGLPVDVIEPTPVTGAQLKRVHKPNYVDDVLACRRANGFSDLSPGVAASLPWTSGSMLSAARHALRSGGVACAPCAGFHHARYAAGGGYCTFNGLMVTAAALHDEGQAARVGILDCDMHWGDGTAAIIGVLDDPGWIRHFSSGRGYCEPGQAAEFFMRLEEEVEACADCDLVLYQAGGYQQDNDGSIPVVLEIHLNTAREAIGAFENLAP